MFCLVCITNSLTIQAKEHDSYESKEEREKKMAREEEKEKVWNIFFRMILKNYLEIS